MKKLLTLTAIAALVAGTAQAVPTLTVTDGTVLNTFTVSDAGTGDLNPGTGLVTFSGAVGSWNVNVNTGIGGPPAPLGTATHPFLDLSGQNNFDGTVGTGNVLTITFTDDNLGPIASFLHHISTGYTVQNMTAVFNLLVNGVVVDTLNGFNLSDNVNIQAPEGSTVSLQAILTATGNTAFTSFDTGGTSAPDGGMTLAMLGLGMTGLVVFARNRKTA